MCLAFSRRNDIENNSISDKESYVETDIIDLLIKKNGEVSGVYTKCARDIHCDMPFPSVMSPLCTTHLRCYGHKLR